MPGNLPGIRDTKQAVPYLRDLRSKWGEAEDKQRNKEDVCQVVVSATEKNKAGGGDTLECYLQEVRAGARIS